MAKARSDGLSLPLDASATAGIILIKEYLTVAGVDEHRILRPYLRRVKLRFASVLRVGHNRGLLVGAKRDDLREGRADARACAQ